MPPLPRSILLCVTLLFSVAAYGQSLPSSPETLSLHSALRRSLRHNPEIARLGETLADRLATAIEAEVKLNPTATVSRGVVLAPMDRGSTYGFSLEQPLRPSDFGLRELYANALRVTANTEQQADVIRLLNDTAITFYRLWALQEREALLETARGLSNQAVEFVGLQLKVGQGNLSQQSIFQADAARFGAELVAVRGERAGMQGDLQRATGLAFRNLRVERPSFGPIPEVFALTRFAESRSGIRRIVLARRAAAMRALDVAMADRFPEFTPGLSYSYNSMDKEAEFAFSVAARLPLWDKNEGPITRARGALEAATRELAAFDRVSLDRLIEARRRQALDLEARAVAFRSEVIPAYQTAYDATQEQLKAGQATTLQLYEVQRSLIDAREKWLDYEVQALSARTQLEQLLGGKIEEVTGDISFRVAPQNPRPASVTGRRPTLPRRAAPAPSGKK